MKKTLVTVAILSVLFMGCKQTNEKKTDETVEATETVHQHGDMHSDMALDNSWVNEIKLDNGNKWEANVETTQGVAKMEELIKSSNPKTVEDYHQLASALNEVKNYVVKECTMEGPSHDNLHVFLHPLIEKIDALGEVSSVEKGEEITGQIQENLDSYYNYFD